MCSHLRSFRSNMNGPDQYNHVTLIIPQNYNIEPYCEYVPMITVLTYCWCRSSGSRPIGIPCTRKWGALCMLASSLGGTRRQNFLDLEILKRWLGRCIHNHHAHTPQSWRSEKLKQAGQLQITSAISLTHLRGVRFSETGPSR